jgi:hypothetical protein
VDDEGFYDFADRCQRAWMRIAPSYVRAEQELQESDLRMLWVYRTSSRDFAMALERAFNSEDVTKRNAYRAAVRSLPGGAT